MKFSEHIEKKQPVEASALSLKNFNDNAEAMRFVDVVKRRSTPFIFLTGSGGCGKTALIKIIIEQTRNAVLTATTGIAALNVGGQTIHSLFRFGAKLMLKSDLEKHKCPNDALFNKLEVLVIDEISMLRADLLDAIDFLLRKWRNNNFPFGGVMVIGSGDLLQLPPVVGREEAELFYRIYPSAWFFYANVISQVNADMVELTKMYRQTDHEFICALNRIRENNDHRESVGFINRNCFRDVDPNFVPDLTLCATNETADRINLQSLNAINGELKTYIGKVEGNINIKSRLPAPMQLMLKVGCRVMITKNLENAVNGQLGVVKSLGEDSVVVALDGAGSILIEVAEWKKISYKVDRMTNQIESQESGDCYSQIPLCLAFAISIHKSQGLTIDKVLIDLGQNKAFASGMTYTALSRCRSIKGIKLVRPISMGDVVTDKNILKFYEAVRKNSQAA